MSQGAFRPAGGGNGGGSAGSGKRTVTLQLSLSALITTIIVGLIGIGWIFAFGVIVGRGHNPEKKMPELARLLPAAEEENAPRDILKPEELTFMSDLKGRPHGAGNATVPKSGAAVDPARAAKGDPKAESRPDPKTGQGTGAQAAKPAESPPASKGQFDVVYQLVAYKNSSQADTLRERLEGEGLRTRMTIERDNAGKPRWYRVQVLYRGTEADVDNLKTRLARFGLKDATVISRKPVGKAR